MPSLPTATPPGGGANGVSAAELNAQAITTAAFTYQGQLKKGATLVTDNCSLAFRLYDAASAGTLIAGPITTSVSAVNGLFAVPLYWGGGYGSPFQGDGRWLDILVKCSTDSAYAALSPREREVMALVVRGKLNKQIAYELGLSEKTVKIHRGRVMEKMQVQSVADLVLASQKLPSL